MDQASEDRMKRNAAQLFEAHYDLGRAVVVTRFLEGDENNSFCIEAEADGRRKKWFFRQYFKLKQPEKIRYEHALLAYIKQRDPAFVAAPVACRNGSTWFRHVFDGEANYYALFEFLEGEKTAYTWVYNIVPEKTFHSCVHAIARYHRNVEGFISPPGTVCEQEDIFSFMQTWHGFMVQALKEMQKDVRTKLFTDYMSVQTDLIARETGRLLPLRRRMQKLPVTHIHTDLQYANFKFRNGEVTALFDFDWAMEGQRLYDVAYAAKSYCASWAYESMGEINLHKVVRFVSIYNEAMRGSVLGPLNSLEIELFPAMIQIGLMRVAYDQVFELYHDRGRNVFEYYLRGLRFIKSIAFMRENSGTMIELTKAL